MLRFWFFFISIRFRFDFFTKNLMSVRFRFRFFRQEISYTSPINLGAAMLNYSGEAGEAGNDSERSTTVARLYSIHVCAYVKFCRHTLHGYGSTLRRFDCCMLCEKLSLGHSFISAVSLTKVPGCEAPDVRRRRPGLTVIIAPPTHVRPQLTVVSLTRLAYIV